VPYYPQQQVPIVAYLVWVSLLHNYYLLVPIPLFKSPAKPLPIISSLLSWQLQSRGRTCLTRRKHTSEATTITHTLLVHCTESLLNMSTQPLLQRTAQNRIAQPVRVEPKVFFANERSTHTFFRALFYFNLMMRMDITPLLPSR
jgi:hypothetical protein